jgi:hypothetical protein
MFPVCFKHVSLGFALNTWKYHLRIMQSGAISPCYPGICGFKDTTIEEKTKMPGIRDFSTVLQRLETFFLIMLPNFQ